MGDWEDLDGLEGCAVCLEDGVPTRVSMLDTDDDAFIESVREAIEEKCGCWIETLCSDGWEPGEGADEAVATVELSDEQPTHRIVFTDTLGATRVDVVLLHTEPGDDPSVGVAYTHTEWDEEGPAAWGVTDGRWYCEGQATPGGESGSVEVTRLR